MITTAILTACVSFNNTAVLKLVDDKADKYGIQRNLLHAIVQQESRYNPDAVNHNAPISSYGIGQITINTAKDKCGLHHGEIMDLRKNLDCAAKILSKHLQRYGGDEWKAISAYNAGSFTRKNYKYTLSVLGRMSGIPTLGCPR